MLIQISIAWGVANIKPTAGRRNGVGRNARSRHIAAAALLRIGMTSAFSASSPSSTSRPLGISDVNRTDAHGIPCHEHHAKSPQNSSEIESKPDPQAF